MSRRTSWFCIWSLIGVSALVLAGAVFACTLFYTRWGLEHVTRWVNQGISSGIMGTLEVSRIDRLQWGRVEARGITIRAPDGKPAIEARHAIIDFDPLQVWSKQVGWSRAEIDHCLVHVTEDEHGDINMEKVFEKRRDPSQPKKEVGKKSDDATDLDLRSMVTSDCRLIISGGSMPTLEMQDLAGIMRVHVPPDGDCELRFDNYSGTFTDGLPTGELVFRNVAGAVMTSQDNLLHFDGQGRTRGSEVAFALHISTKPKQVRIDAKFPEVSFASMSTRAVAVWSKLSPTLELNVSQVD
ncbi:MAG: hypothetical protein RLZZ450_6011 [Pseudomonadota bacterium]